MADTFVRDIDRHNAKEWRQYSNNIGAEIRNFVENTPTGHAIRSLVEEQVRYIKSLPLEAAGRIYDIHNRAIEAVVSGGRAKPFADKITASGDVAKSRATLIARTETGRASTALIQIRALSLGSEGYIWRTADDGDVRQTHARMNDKFVRWDSTHLLFWTV